MSLQILLVDDEPAIKIGFRQLTDWSKTPYTLCGTAGNGKEALAYLEKNPVDIIITDLKMSVMDGIGLIHALKQNNSEIPIIVLSSYSDFELVREALTAGAADYILKANISADSLIAHLDKVAGNLLNRQKDRAAALLQKQQLEEQNTQILMNDIRNFFLDETITTEELLKETSDLAFFSVPCIVLTLFFHEDMKREKLKRVAPNIQTLLTETLALAASPVSIMMHHNELAFFLPYSDTLKYNISSKTQVLNRQIATYFGVLPILCYSAPAAGAAECRDAYFSCINARRITFYEKNRSIIFTKDIRFVFEISAEEIQETMNSVLNFVQTGSRENLFGYVRNLLAEWSALPLEPFHLCMNCVHIFEGVALSGKSGKLHAQIHDYQKKISQSTSLAELKVTLCDALLLLLESNENNYEKWLETNQKWLETAGFHTACLWNTTNKERFGRYMQTCGLQGVFDGFENNKERYEVGKDGEGVVCILQGAHCWEEGDVYKDLISVKPNGQKPVFRNVYLIAASYGGVGGYERLIRELQRVESYLPNTYEFLLPMDLCATLKEYIEKNGGNGHE